LGFLNFNYLERLEKINLTKLEEIRDRVDIIQFLKVISELNITNRQIAPSPNHSKLELAEHGQISPYQLSSKIKLLSQQGNPVLELFASMCS